jgi:hypothetical protein
MTSGLFQDFDIMLTAINLTADSGETIQAQLNQMQPRHLEDFEIAWQEVLQNLSQDDAFWSWAMKKRLSLVDNRFEAYAIEYKKLTQGLLWLETRWHCSWANPDQRLVYVEAIAAAPWNRGLIQSPPYLKGVGAALLFFARQRSLALGYNGRVGLHALPASEGFYHHEQMLDYGEDPDKDNLRYFEFGIME